MAEIDELAVTISNALHACPTDDLTQIGLELSRVIRTRFILGDIENVICVVHRGVPATHEEMAQAHESGDLPCIHMIRVFPEGLDDEHL